MWRTWIASLIFAIAVCAGQSQAGINHGAPTLCPKGSSYSDGCPGAPVGGNFQVSNFFTSYAAQSSQTYATRPPWNVAGVDYPVGIPAASLPLKDPTTASLPAHCSYSSGIVTVVCQNDSGAGVTFDGYDFSLHNCVNLQFNGTVTGPVVIKNSNFAFGSACQTRNPYYLLELNGSSITIENNYFDGGGAAWGKDGSGNVGVAIISASVSTLNGSMTVEYNAFLHGPGRFISYNTCVGTAPTTCGDFTWEFNYGEGMIYQSFAEHGEMTFSNFGSAAMNAGDVQSNAIFSYSTWLEPLITGITGAAGSTSMIAPFVGAGAGPYTNTITNTQVDHNTEVANSNSEMSASVTVSTLGVWLAYGYFTSVTIENNYLDPTGSYYCFSQPSGGNGQGVGSATFLGNIDLLDGSAWNKFDTSPATCPGSK